MKIKYSQLQSIDKGLYELNKQKMSYSTKRALLPSRDALVREAEWYNEQYNELVNLYSEKDESGNPVMVDDKFKLSDAIAFKEKLEELLNTETDIPSIDSKIIESFDFDGEVWDCLMPIIKEGD